MRPFSIALSLGAQTSYAELYDMATSVEMTRFASLRGSFHRRQIKGRPYVYFNFRDTNGRARSTYVGPENARVQSLVNDFEQAQTASRVETLARRAHACIALGCGGVRDRHYRIIHKLASYGIFRRGGVLIGADAFAAMGNTLGVRWEESTEQGDVEVAHADHRIGVVLRPALERPVAFADAIQSLEMGELPIREASGRTAAQSTNPGGSGLHLDLIATQSDGGRQELMSELGIKLEPRQFVEVLLKDTIKSVVFARSGACLVNLPEPARFAVYSLLAFGEKHRSGRATDLEHLVQAASLIEWHLDQGRHARLRRVWQDALRRGPVWARCAEIGRRALVKWHSEFAHLFA